MASPDDLVDDLNSGTLWTEEAIRDLRWCIENHEPTGAIATFLCVAPAR
jgi:hypothetical protein